MKYEYGPINPDVSFAKCQATLLAYWPIIHRTPLLQSSWHDQDQRSNETTVNLHKWIDPRHYQDVKAHV